MKRSELRRRSWGGLQAVSRDQTTGVRRTHRYGILSIGVGIALLATGCSSLQTVAPGDLPASLAVYPAQSPNTLDLTRLSSPRASSDVLQPGDQLELTVATGVPDADIEAHPVRLDSQGAANLPLVGAVQLAGLRVPEAELAVRDEAVRRGIYRTPQVALSVEKRLNHRVTVAGAIEKPGVKEIPSASSDLFTALSESGRFLDNADTLVEITYPPRPNAEGALLPGEKRQVDLVKATLDGGAYPLPDGSAVMVRRKAPQTIHVDGLVRNPRKIDLPYDRPFRLLDAISEAGGRRLSIADKIYVSRIDPESGEARVIKASYRKALQDDRQNLVLGAGDVVTVQDTPTTFTVESVRSFIRFGFSSAVPGF